MRSIVAVVIFLALTQSVLPVGAAEYDHPSAPENYFVVGRVIRTELYFGRNRNGGKGTVSDDEWQDFVDEYVTLRFPSGLTIVDADGQWRSTSGAVEKERSKVLILIYPRKHRRAADTKIEEIRAEYKRRFAQQSVMRIDMNATER